MSGYDAASPPAVKRTVPWEVVMHLILSGRLFQLGIIPLFAGIALVYCAKPIIVSAFAFRGALRTAQGQVYLSQDTGATAGSSPIYENRYTYVLPNGSTHYGISYGHAEDPSGDAPVTVVYSVSKPDVSRIKGMQNHRGSMRMVVLAVLVLVAGLVITVIGLFENILVYNVLRQGALGTAVLVDKIQTKKAVNQHAVYHYIYDFTFPSGKIKRQSVFTFEWLSESQPVLYRSSGREYFALIVAMPGKVILTNGKISSAANLSQSLIIPTIAVAVSIAIFVSLK